MIFRQLFDTDSSTYTYLLACEQSRDAVLIDSVFEQHKRDAAQFIELAVQRFDAVARIDKDVPIGSFEQEPTGVGWSTEWLVGGRPEPGRYRSETVVFIASIEPG